MVNVGFGGGATQSGFFGTTGDATFVGVGFAANNVHPFTNTDVSGPNAFVPRTDYRLHNHIPASFAGQMPAVDFYGNVRTWPGAPGAVR